MCPTRAKYCFAAPTDPTTDKTFCTAVSQEVCEFNCNRDVMATPQVVYVPLTQDIIIDVSIDENATVHEWIEVPGGALGDSRTFRITPVTAAQQLNGFVRINQKAVLETYQQAGVGTPFTCSVDGGLLGASFPLNLTVWGNVDKQAFAPAGTVRPKYTLPCDWATTWSLRSVGGAPACVGTATFTETTMQLSWNKANFSSACPTVVLSGVLAAAPVDVNHDGNFLNVLWNVTKTDAANTAIIPVGTQVCFSMNGIGLGDQRVLLSIQPSTVCPQNIQTSSNGTLVLGLTQIGAPDPTCTGDNAVIDSVNLCFGIFDTYNREFRCLTGYYERTTADFGTDDSDLPGGSLKTTGFRSWWEGSGRRSSLIRGRLSSCQPSYIYGFYNVPLPPPPVKHAHVKTFWEKYGAIILSISIISIILLIVGIYAISRLIRYRRKYREEKKEAQELRQEATMMAETMGGLGVWDEEVQMVSNPLVLQFNEQKQKLDKLDATLNQREEQDAVEMDKLDKERQMILNEMERLKKALGDQQAAKTASRADDAPAVRPAATATGPTPSWDNDGSGGQGDQHTFEPQGMGAKPKKRDL